MQLCRKLFMGGKPTSNTFADERTTLPVEQGLVEKTQFITAGMLGEGGFGKVLTGMMLKNGCWYAIKEIKKIELVKHKMGLSMIFNELAAMKRVNHPAVINLHFAFHDKKRCFFVLDLKTGGDLRYYLRKRYVFEECDVAFYIAAISSALDHIHSKNIIHRDVKPENIILDERGYPFLTDFGVAHVQPESNEQTTLTCTLASGTKQYLAPEVFTKSHIHGPEIDFWSLGVVAYELLFGKRPFDKHCPITFISYLENALTLKKKQLKERKLRQRSTLFVNCNDENPTSPRELLRPSLSRDPYGPMSRSNSIDSSSSPSGSTSQKRTVKTLHRNSGEQKSQASKGNNFSGFPSPARTMSTDLGSISQDSSRELQFCSSVGVTNVTGCINSDHSGFNTPKHFAAGSGGSPGNTKLTRNGSWSQPTSPVSGSPPLQNGKFFLPDLKITARSQSPPRSLFTGNNSHSPNSLRRSGTSRNAHRLPPSASGIAGTDTDDYGEILIGGDSFDMGSGNASNSHLERQTIREEDESSLDESGRTVGLRGPIRAIPGDHWLVEDGILHPSLYVDLPESNSWLGPISRDCQRVLAGLFEVRPSHRLGAGNMTSLKRSRWFEKLKITDWDELLQTRRFEPHFQPGKRFIKECLDRMDDAGEAKILGEDDTSDSGDFNLPDLSNQLTIEEENAFNNFYHIAMQHEEMFNNQSFSNTKSPRINSGG